MSLTTNEGTVWVPHRYQERAVEIMVSQGAAGLLMDPGLGKTSCALQAFKILHDLGYVRRALVIAPLRPMLHTWTAEIDKCSNSTIMRAVGGWIVCSFGTSVPSS